MAFKFNKKASKKENEVEVPQITAEELEEMNQEIYDTSFYSELETLDSEENLDMMSREDTDRQVEQMYDSGMDFEEIERFEYRSSAKKARQTEYRAKVQDRADFLQALLTPNMIVGYIVTVLLSTLYLWFTTSQLAFSLLISLVGSVVIVYWYIYRENKLDIRQEELTELESLARDITMQADIASNTYEVVAKMADKYDKGRVGNDVNMLYSKLDETGELDTSRFNLYDFTPVELFMRNLEIWYTEGADTRKIFTRSVNDITFELLKRDELRKTNKKMLKTELITAGIGLAIPVIIRATAGQVYSVLLGVPVIVSVMMLVHYVGIIGVIVSLKKRALDISIR